MALTDIVIRGAREHNLQSIEVTLPRNALICLTGVSGSGKSSLAFDTLFAEGQRRYVESLSSYARQFLGQMPKPDVDHISGLSPSISISQKSSGRNPRSTVGTITELYDFLRILYARIGKGHCPQCGQPIAAQSREAIAGQLLQLEAGTRFSVLAPVIRGQRGEYRELFEDLLRQGFVRARVDGTIVSLSDDLQLDRRMRHDIEVVVDRLVAGDQGRGRVTEAVELALKIGQGTLIALIEPRGTAPAETEPSAPPAASDLPGAAGDDAGSSSPDPDDAPVPRRPGRARELLMSVEYACGSCGIGFEPPSPQIFSFNSPRGMCSRCAGLGTYYAMDPELLVPDPSRSLKQGCIEPVGRWSGLGRWRRHIFQGVADTMERVWDLPAGTLLESPWEQLTPQQQRLWLWGAGDQHITYTWRSGANPMMYGGEFDGVIPELMEKYRAAKRASDIRKLEAYMRTMTCPDCGGQRINPQARAITLTTQHPDFEAQPALSLPEICRLSVLSASRFFAALELDPTQALIAEEALKEIRARLGFLINVGLEYLSLDRTAPTLSGGETQRIRLASQIGSGLVGVLYILDEPSIGLHPRDNDRLLHTLQTLRDMGNTVVVVEHDEDTMRAADYVIDFGPGPGVRGGEIVARGTPDEVAGNPRSLTGKYLSGELTIRAPVARHLPTDKQLRVIGAAHNNLKQVDVEIPLGTFVCVTGVSGSGKSSLVNGILVEALRQQLNGGLGSPGAHQRLEGLEHLDKMIAIDQSPIGRTPRSNPGTYIKVFDEIRKLFAQLPEAKRRGFTPGRFSFNVKQGRCEACEGNGSNRLEMDFLADIWVTCPVCEGHRFSRETLQVRFKDRSIAEVLEMDVQQALELFENIPRIRDRLQTLHDVGLDYLKIGQPSPTLSGGEAQRIKLARELVKRSTGKTLYLLDEPTTGLHFADIQLLLNVLHRFVEQGNTVLVVEHNLDVIKNADWIIDLGPEGGGAGGRIVASGPPEQIAEVAESHTGRALARMLDDEAKQTWLSRKSTPRTPGSDADALEPGYAERILVRGAKQHNLRGVDAEIRRDSLTVFCGPSGSGKTSLAMETIYAEGQRRYVESLSAYARQFVSQMQKPRLDHIEGLSPAIAIEQKNLGNTPRSTVGTVTEIYDYLRILYSRLGQGYCPDCDIPIGTQTVDQIVDKVLKEPEGTRLYLMAPLEWEQEESDAALWESLRTAGYARVRVDGETHPLDSAPAIDRRRRHEVDVVVDRVVVKANERSRIAESIEGALAVGRGVLRVAYADAKLPEPRWKVRTHSQHLTCEQCERSFDRLSPHNFSFNSALGWCYACDGLGIQHGANPLALLRDSRATLADGAVLVWPDLRVELAQQLMRAFSDATGVPVDVPFDELTARQRRLVFHGARQQWFDVPDPADPGRALLRFQYKGIYPALEEAARLVPELRYRLQNWVGEVECSMCGGSRLRDDAAAMRYRDLTIYDLCCLPLGRLHDELRSWKLSPRDQKIAGELLTEVRNRVEFLVDVGLDYLTLARTAASLSNGEAQRIRLASQLGSGLCGVLYVLDEPTIGLHPRDNTRLLRSLYRLRDLGNTMLLVEHDREVIEGSDAVFDFGPGAGHLGGQITASGTPQQLARMKHSLTGQYLSGSQAIPVPLSRRLEFSPLPGTAQQPEVRRTLAAAPAGDQGDDVGGRATPKQTARNKKGTKQGGTNKKGTNKKGTNKKDTNKKDTTRKAAAAKNAGANPADPLGGTAAAPAAGAGLPAGQPQQVGPHTITPRMLAHSLVDWVDRAGHRPDWLKIEGARYHNLRSVNAAIPVGTLTVVTGPSGSGKSTLVYDVLEPAMMHALFGRKSVNDRFERIMGIPLFNKVISVDQQPLGNSPMSNPATYTGVFDLIRQLYAQLPEARVRGYTARRFSANVPGGRCEDCAGNGKKCIEMHFLPDVWVTCETCQGKRYSEETLEVKFHGYSINDVLEMTCGEAARHLFQKIPKIRRILETLCDVGLDYLRLGQSAPTLSGGEAQRVKLAAELARPDTGRTLYLLDEPTTGLHFDDLKKLLEVIQRLVDLGNTVLVIEHNLDIIKAADYVIEMGPEAGAEGGRVVVSGPPEHVVAYSRLAKPTAPTEPRDSRKTKNTQQKKKAASISSTLPENLPLPRCHTGEALDPVLEAGPYEERRTHTQLSESEPDQLEIRDVGRGAQMPWQVDGRQWHVEDRVDRQGQPCHWEGKILAEIVDRIQSVNGFSETNWDSPSVVEIGTPTRTTGWFFHAITAESYFVRLKFRCPRKALTGKSLAEQLQLRTWNQLPEIPKYGNQPRIKIKSLRGPLKEVQIDVCTFAEIDVAEFWTFLEQARDAFLELALGSELQQEAALPWLKLGEKWHFMRRGFPPGKGIRWELSVLRSLCDLLRELAPQAEFDWNAQQQVYVRVPGQKIPWATLYTKRPKSLVLKLNGPKDALSLGQISDIGSNRDLDTSPANRDTIRLSFRETADLALEKLRAALSRQLDAIARGANQE